MVGLQIFGREPVRGLRSGRCLFWPLIHFPRWVVCPVPIACPDGESGSTWKTIFRVIDFRWACWTYHSGNGELIWKCGDFCLISVSRNCVTEQKPLLDKVNFFFS